MQVDLTADFPVTDAACKAATGKTLKQWFKVLEENPALNTKRRDAISWMYDQMENRSDVWWPTTIWVEYERSKGVVNKKDGRIEGYNICVTKTLAAPLSEVFKAWTDVKALNTWFGSKVKVKVADGGTFEDGDGNSGEYTRVRKDKDLRFTWTHPDAEASTLVDVAFSDKGKGKTGLMLNHQRIQNRNEADGLRRAWGQCFDLLKDFVEKA